MTPTMMIALKAAIDANPVFGILPNTATDADFIATQLNAMPATDFFIWKNAVPAQVLFAAIIWENFIPSDPPDDTVVWTNRALYCQSKQLNVQIMLTGREYISPSLEGTRNGLQNALTAIPAGAAGVNQSAGWAEMRLTIQRKATYGEQLLSSGGDGTTANPGTPLFEEQALFFDYQIVSAARSL